MSEKLIREGRLVLTGTLSAKCSISAFTPLRGTLIGVQSALLWNTNGGFPHEVHLCNLCDTNTVLVVFSARFIYYRNVVHDLGQNKLGTNYFINHIAMKILGTA